MTSASEFVNAAGDIGAGHVLGRYELLMPIASGGMAMVWAARLKGTRGFQKIVAIKTMLPKLSEDDQFEQMFLDEASLASQIRHPHVVEIMDLGEEDGILYLVMEMVDGVPLNQLMKAAKKSGGIPLPIAVRIIIQACAGLHSAHELRDRDGQLVGLVHRDVSPQNILVTYDGVTKVVDFGIAKATAIGGGATVAGQIKGKVAYMAPEQVKGGAIDRRVDVFALGIVLYALTTGKHPLRRESEAATMYSICSPEPVVFPSKIIQGYPSALEKVVLQALAKDADKRFTTANDLLRALDALPATMRASTDEDVGNFVKSLFGERRDERQAALQHALDLADRQALEEQRTLRAPSQTGTHSSVSSVSSVGGSGITSSQGVVITGDDARLSVAGANTLDVVAADNPFTPPGRRKLVVSAVLVGIVALLGLVVVLAGGSSGKSVAAGATSGVAPTVSSPTAPTALEKTATESGAATATESTVASGTSAQNPAPEVTATASATSTTAEVTSPPPVTTSTSTGWSVRPVGAGTRATTGSSTGGWNRQDPGF